MPPRRTNRTRVVPVWRCPCCFLEALMAGEQTTVYLPLPELKTHLAEVHGFEWDAHTQKHYKSWTLADDRILCKRQAEGIPVPLIAEELKRTKWAVYARLSLIKNRRVA